jgi:hypothetical protein
MQADRSGRATGRSDGAYRGRQHPGKGPRDYTNGARRSKNSDPRPPLSKAPWARPEGLVTTRRANDQKERQNREAETMQYLNKRDEEEDFPGTVSNLLSKNGSTFADY